MPRRRRALLFGVGLALACTPVEGTVEPELPASPGPRCDGVEQVGGLWSAARRDDLAAALEQVPGEWPRQLLASLDARLPGFAKRWSATYVQACEAGSAGRMGCLDAQRWTLDAWLTLVAEQPERAASLWVALERVGVEPDVCTGAEPSVAAPELTPARGRELASLALLIELRELDRVEQLLRVLEADPSVMEVDAHAWRVALARAWVEHGAGRTDSASDALARAQSLGEQVDPRAPLLVADAHAAMLEAGGDPSEAARAREQALALARELGDAWLVVEQLLALGRARLGRGDASGAAAPLIEAIALAGRVGSPDNPRTAGLQTVLAAAQLELGQVEAASDALTQARDAFVIALGPDHPQTLATVEAIGRLFVAAGRLGDAQFAFLDLLEVYTELYGVKDWRTAKIKLELADSLMAMDQHESARELYTEALTPLAQALGAVDPAVVRASIHLGIAELALGNLEAAQPHCARGRDLAKALAPGDPLADEAERCLAEIAARSKPKPKPRR